jgi:hypothetical protein
MAATRYCRRAVESTRHNNTTPHFLVFKDSAFRNKLATDIVTRLKAARDGPSDIFSGISVNTAVSDQTVIDAVSQTLEQISKQNCQQNVSQGARVLVGNGGKLIIGQQSEAFLAAAATGCFERNNERACKALETGCGSLNITQELGVTGDCEQIDKITQTLENVLDVKVESDVSATSGANLALIFGIIGGILLLGLIIGLIAWAVSKSQKDKKKKEAEQQAQQQLVQRRQQAFQTRAAAPRQEFRSQTLATPPARPPTRFSDLSAVSGSAGTLSSTAKPARLAGTAFESQPSAASETYFQ